MAFGGPTGDFAGESPEAPNAHLTSLPNAKKDMFNVGRRQCLEKRNTGWKSPACIKERLPTSAHTKKRKKRNKNNRLTRMRRVVSHAIRPAPSPPEASRATNKPPIRSPIITVVVNKVYFVSCFCNLVQALYCLAVQFSS
jgi:hypothetical protein